MTLRAPEPLRLFVFALPLLAPVEGAAQWLDLDVPERPSADATDVEAGRQIYEERCWFCHGEDGNGMGPVAEYLWPRPRDFIAGSYKLRTTESGELPTDEDLFRSVSLGLKGTAMPEWGSKLTVEERWQVISYIKAFAADLFEDEEFDPYQRIVELGEPPSGSANSLIEAGRLVYEEAKCSECHGALGRGDGERAGEITDDWEFPIWPANLNSGWRVKGGSSIREIYLRFTTGLDGTPMPSYSETLSEEERWQLAYYVASLNETPETGTSATVIISAHHIDGSLPGDAHDPAWNDAAKISIPLTGQATYAPRWQIQAVTDLSVQALYNADELVLRLVWDDRFADTAAVDSAAAMAAGWEADDTFPRIYPDGRRVRGTYPDAAEVMFPIRHDGGPVLPHFVYGSAGQPVDLWRWRADIQHSSSTTSPVVELRASGGREPPQPHAGESQLTRGVGVWRDGRWTVIVRRPLQTEDGTREVQLQPGQVIPIAFHVWDGANGETGLKMALSSWYFLHLQESAPATSYLAVMLAVLGALTLEYVAVLWMRNLKAQGRLTRFGVEAGS